MRDRLVFKALQGREDLAAAETWGPVALPRHAKLISKLFPSSGNWGLRQFLPRKLGIRHVASQDTYLSYPVFANSEPVLWLEQRPDPNLPLHF